MLPFFGLTLPKLSGVVSISNVTVSSVGAGAQTCSYTLQASGVRRVNSTQFGPVDSTTEWLVPNNADEANAYEARATMTVGTLTTGTVDTWIDCSTGPSWDKTDVTAADGAAVATFTLEIRRKSDGTVLDSATVSLEPDRS